MVTTDQDCVISMGLIRGYPPFIPAMPIPSFCVSPSPSSLFPPLLFHMLPAHTLVYSLTHSFTLLPICLHIHSSRDWPSTLPVWWKHRDSDSDSTRPTVSLRLGFLSVPLRIGKGWEAEGWVLLLLAKKDTHPEVGTGSVDSV